MIRHVAMFKFKDGVSQDQKVAARDALANLKTAVPSVVEYTVGFDIERNPNNWDMVLVGIRRFGRTGGVLRPSGHESGIRSRGLRYSEGNHGPSSDRDLRST